MEVQTLPQGQKILEVIKNVQLKVCHRLREISLMLPNSLLSNF